MRTADRYVAREWAFPLGLRENVGFMEDVRTSLVHGPCPVVVADNVARYLHDRNAAICLEDYPSLAPPWERCWIEYPSSGHHRRGVWVVDASDQADTPMTESLATDTSLPDLAAAAKRDAVETNGVDPEDVRWVLALCLFVEQDRRIWGPAGIMTLALDRGGQVIGNRWSLAPISTLMAPISTLMTSAMADPGPVYGDGDPLLSKVAELGDIPFDQRNAETMDRIVKRHDALGVRIGELEDKVRGLSFLRRGGLVGTDQDWFVRALSAALQTIAFLHCKNVVVEQVEPPAKVRAKRHKKGKPALRYNVLRLDVPRRQGSGGGSANPDPHALHIVAGHFAHYGGCCPHHVPKGLLFGRLTGVYWVPSHVRGDRIVGKVLTDFDVKPVEATA